QLKNYLLHGNIKNSVNLPDCDMGPATKPRITVINRNVAGVVGPITSILADAKLNIADMTNKSRNDYAYNIIDIDGFCSGNVIGLIEQVPGVVRVRLINGGNNG
ncbi:MAG: 3-phosphoglycerate dehydrogenase, partial [Alphaproteobacteria bacterium]|nr:3-phosphoglycerate dehydrogenase [Alphaproteobacteria bacterium]